MRPLLLLFLFFATLQAWDRKTDRQWEEYHQRQQEIYDQRGRHSQIQGRDIAPRDLEGFQMRHRERSLQRSSDQRARESNVQFLGQRKIREKQMSRLERNSWHRVPHNNASSARRRDYIQQYTDGPYRFDKSDERDAPR